MQLLLALVCELGLSQGAAPAEPSLLGGLGGLFCAHGWAQSQEVSSTASCSAAGVVLEFSSWEGAREGECWGNFEAKAKRSKVEKSWEGRDRQKQCTAAKPCLGSCVDEWGDKCRVVVGHRI